MNTDPHPAELPLPPALARELSRADRNYLVIALTGSIGTGKSAVADRLAALGATIIDADILARAAVEPGSPALREIAAHFGNAVLRPDGSLDRAKLGEVVFHTPAEREWLERCVHPRIRELFLARLTAEIEATSATVPHGGRRLIVYVVPLLFESPAPRPEFDYVVVVTAPRATSIERIMQRDGSSRELAERKLGAQLPIEEKERRADRTVANVGSLAELDGAVERLYRDLQKLPPRPASPTPR